MTRTVIWILIFSLSVIGQTLKAEDGAGIPSEKSAKRLFEEARDFGKRSESNPASDALPPRASKVERIVTQKEFAANSAALLAARKDLTLTDRHYLGMLYWIAGDLSNAETSLLRSLAAAELDAEQKQLSRSILVIINAKQKDFDVAEQLLSAFSAAKPLRASDAFRLESEISVAYQAVGNITMAIPHAEKALKSATAIFAEQRISETAVDQLLEAGLHLFELNQAAGNKNKAVAALEELRNSAQIVEAPVAYYLATDELVKYLIDIGEKNTALKIFEDARIGGISGFQNQGTRDDLKQRLDRREIHYSLLGEMPNPLVDVVKSINGETITLDQLKGKVVLLDFWATWCGPCIEAFPTLRTWHEQFNGDLEIVGITRFYGFAGAKYVNAVQEFEYLKSFVSEQKIDYRILVSDGIANQLRFGAMNLPTAVLLDRSGRVRYIEIGTSGSRLIELRKKLVELIGEK